MPRGIPKAKQLAMEAAAAATQTASTVVAERPVPESELTPEQQRIRDLENQLAQERGRKDPEVEFDPPAKPGAADNILIHFLEDGITALGHIWRRGQELEFEPGSAAYRDTCDRFGRTWLELVDDEFGQVERWGKVMFRRGPWPGKDLRAAATAQFERLKSLTNSDATVAGPTAAELEEAVKAEARRNRAAPRLPAR